MSPSLRWHPLLEMVMNIDPPTLVGGFNQDPSRGCILCLRATGMHLKIVRSGLALDAAPPFPSFLGSPFSAPFPL